MNDAQRLKALEERADQLEELLRAQASINQKFIDRLNELQSMLTPLDDSQLIQQPAIILPPRLRN